MKTRQTKNTLGLGTDDGSSGNRNFGQDGQTTQGQVRKDTMHFYVCVHVPPSNIQHDLELQDVSEVACDYSTLETEGRMNGLANMAEAVQETVGWAAFDVGHSSLGGVVYEAGKTTPSVTDQPFRIQFTGFFRTVP